MTDLIDRNILIQHLNECLADSTGDTPIVDATIIAIRCAVEQYPTIETKKGEWIDKNIYDAVFSINDMKMKTQVIEAKCSSCNLYSTFDYGRFIAGGDRFCPRCGAEMRKGKKI